MLKKATAFSKIIIRKRSLHGEYDAIITRVKNFGIYFEIIDFPF